MADILGAMYDLVAKFTDLPPDDIVRAWPNRTAAPKVTFCVLGIVTTNRVGQNIVTEPTELGDASQLGFYRTMVQFDFVGAGAESNARRVELLSRSDWLCAFLAPYGMQPIEATDPRDMTDGDGSKQYAVRFTVTLTVGAWEVYTLPVEWFDSVILNTEVIT